MGKNLKNINFITKVSILTVLSFLLTYIHFPLPVAPYFYEMDFVNIPTLIGGFALGPLAAFSIEIFRTILKLIFLPTKTFFIGEISALIINLSFVLSASIFYHYHRNFKGAIISLILGSVSFVLVGVLSNYLFIIPAFVSVARFPLEKIILLGQGINASIHDIASFVIICVLPFNIIKSILTSILVLFVYKRVSFLIK